MAPAASHGKSSAYTPMPPSIRPYARIGARTWLSLREAISAPNAMPPMNRLSTSTCAVEALPTN
jgi:hypothetical protein